MPTPTSDAVRAPDAAATTGSGADRDQTWTIAQVADEFGVTHRTVRHYEELGLISPERRGTTRVYHRRDRTRLGLNRGLAQRARSAQPQTSWHRRAEV